jgi:SAM-dependent methyltransferase
MQWFASWFDSPHYHRLYAHRDDAEAARLVDTLVARLRPVPGAAALDVGCGAGRHARRLAANGLEVTGLDLSAGSIRRAREHEDPHLRFFVHDMRLPFGRSAFDYVFSFFTSFGYFDEPADHLKVIRNMARSLKSRGRLVLDYLNVPYADAHLTPHETVERDGAVYRISRWRDTRHFFKRIAIDGEDGGPPREYVERVARFTVADFLKMFALEGLLVEGIYGDYRLSPYDAGTSPRVILVARRQDEGGESGYLRERLRRMRLTVSGDTPRYEASIHWGTRSAIEG